RKAVVVLDPVEVVYPHAVVVTDQFQRLEGAVADVDAPGVGGGHVDSSSCGVCVRPSVVRPASVLRRARSRELRLAGRSYPVGVQRSRPLLVTRQSILAAAG